MLNMPADIANAIDIQRHVCTRANVVPVAIANTIVTSVAPNVCPTRRAVLCIPPAPPVRLTGVDDTMTILFGV